MQTLTRLLVQQGLAKHILTEDQLARVVQGTAQRRYNLVIRALKSGELQRIKRGLYKLASPYGNEQCHPFVLAQTLVPGSYVSLETALSHHGWIPEAVYTTASITPARKTLTYDHETLGRFTFHPLAIERGYFLELVERQQINGQVMLVAQPMRALMDLVCFKKVEWQGLQWIEQGLRIDREFLLQVSPAELDILESVYKQKRVRQFLQQLQMALHGRETLND